MHVAVIETDFKMTEVWCGGDVCKHGSKSGGPERVFIFMSVHALPLLDFSCVTKCMGRRNPFGRCVWGACIRQVELLPG